MRLLCSKSELFQLRVCCGNCVAWPRWRGREDMSHLSLIAESASNGPACQLSQPHAVRCGSKSHFWVPREAVRAAVLKNYVCLGRTCLKNFLPRFVKRNAYPNDALEEFSHMSSGLRPKSRVIYPSPVPFHVRRHVLFCDVRERTYSGPDTKFGIKSQFDRPKQQRRAATKRRQLSLPNRPT